MNALTDFLLARMTADDIVAPDPAIRRTFWEFSGPDTIWLEEPFEIRDGLPVAVLPELDGECFRRDPAFDFSIRQLVASKKLRTPVLGDLTEKKLARELRSMVGCGRSGLEDLYEITGIAFQSNDLSSEEDSLTMEEDPLTLGPVTDLLDNHIASVAGTFAKLAKIAPETVRLAFQGALATASAELQRIGARVMDLYAIVEALEELARFHLVDSLLQAGDEAHSRVFETTGLDFLDFNGNSQTTKGCILNRMDDQLETLMACLRLFALGKDIPAGDRRLARMKDFATDLRMAALEDAFRSRYGALAETKVRRIVKRLTKRIRKMQRGLKTLKGQPGFRSRPAWSDRGPNPYQMLYLNCSFAVGWLEQHQTVKGEHDPDAINFSSSTRLQVAIRRAKRGIAYESCRHRKPAAEFANRLFFTLRNICVADPRSDVRQIMAKDNEVPSLIDAFRIAFHKHAGREARAVEGGDVERWANDVSSDAIKAYDAATRGSDTISRSFVTEARGRISLRLTT